MSWLCGCGVTSEAGGCFPASDLSLLSSPSPAECGSSKIRISDLSVLWKGFLSEEARKGISLVEIYSQGYTRHRKLLESSFSPRPVFLLLQSSLHLHQLVLRARPCVLLWWVEKIESESGPGEENAPGSSQPASRLQGSPVREGAGPGPQAPCPGGPAQLSALARAWGSFLRQSRANGMTEQ